MTEATRAAALENAKRYLEAARQLLKEAEGRPWMLATLNAAEDEVAHWAGKVAEFSC